MIRWWRASHYQWTGHGHDSFIGPAKGATIRELALPVHGRDFESALQFATETLRARDKGPKDNRGWAYISQAHEKSVCAWCKKYGLLGVLPLGTTEIGLEGAAKEDSESGEQYYAQDLFQRVGGSWSRKTRHGEQVIETDAPPEEELATSVPDRIRIPSDETTYSSYVTWANGAQDEGLDGVNRFFPRRQQDAVMPLPLSDEFWRHYAEPVVSFAIELAEFQDAVTLFGKGQPDRLYRYTDAATLRVWPATRAKRLPGAVWEASSVLSAFALQVMFGASGERVFKCQRPSCPSMVFTTDARKKWCSPRCREAGRKQVWRKK